MASGNWGFATGNGSELTRGWQGTEEQARAKAQAWANEHNDTIEFWPEPNATKSEAVEPESDDESSAPDMTEARKWAREAEAGEYLTEYEDDGLDDVSDPGSMCGFGADELDEIGAILGKRGLKLTADDRGLVAVED